jgi:hypothetical protein
MFSFAFVNDKTTDLTLVKLVMADSSVGDARLGVVVRGVFEMATCKLIVAQGSVVDFEGPHTLCAAAALAHIV